MSDGARWVVVADGDGAATPAVAAAIGSLGIELDVTDTTAVRGLIERVGVDPSERHLLLERWCRRRRRRRGTER